MGGNDLNNIGKTVAITIDDWFTPSRRSCMRSGKVGHDQRAGNEDTALKISEALNGR